MRLFLTTFGLIFLAELPDKTAFATLMMAAERSALGVFLGAAAAFLVQTIVAVALGGLVGLLPIKLVKTVGGLMFFAFAAVLWRRRDEEPEGKKGGATGPASLWADALASFLVIFAAEWGDTTQLATAVLQAQHHQALVIGSAAVLALWSVTALAALAGRSLAGRLKPSLLNRVAAAAFALVGVVVLAQTWLS